MAADSAGTYFGNKMFYNSTNKVFSLSNKYVYGAIIYNRLYLHNVAIEQILKEFKTFLDDQNNLNDFYDIISEFRKFIKQKNSYYKFDAGEQEGCNSIIDALAEKWGGRIKAVIGKGDDETQINNILAELKNDIASKIKAQDYDVKDHIHANYFDRYEQQILKFVPEIQGFPDQKRELWDLFSEYFNIRLVSEEKDEYTGLFFAGYGQLDAFPKYIHVKMSKVVDGQIKLAIVEKFEGDGGAQIMPLAQDDVIYTFCQGISQIYLDAIPAKIEESICSKIDNLPATFTDIQKAELKAILKDCKANVVDEIRTIMREKNVSPLIKNVKLIPLPEMAFLAENLVNMTSLKRTYSLDGNQQTVGGHTDVAILSKGDGFVWIKRKQNGATHFA